MNGMLKVALSLSLAGSLTAAAVALLRPLLRGRVSRRWQYYVWLVVIVRMLVPLAPEENLVGNLFRLAEAPPVQVQPVLPAAAPVEPVRSTAAPSGEGEAAAAPSLRDAAQVLGENLGLLWLAAALALLVRKATAYQSFSRYIRASGRAVDDPAVLDLLAELGAQVGVKRPVELLVCPLAASPMLLGVARPCVVLPSLELTGEELRCTLLHELVHCRRWDGACKWLVEIAVCVHWYNPAAYWIAREISRDCELACDEAVLALLAPEERHSYGGTLLRALGSGLSGETAPVRLCEDGKLLKERLDAIMKFQKRSKRTAALSLTLALALLAGATAAGAYVGPAKKPAEKPGTVQKTQVPTSSGVSAVQTGSAGEEAQRAYDLDNLPRFDRAFAKLGKAEQTAWMEKLYDEGEIAFFSVGLDALADGETVSVLAERAYRDGNIAFFSRLTGELDEESLEIWLARAEDDRRSSFQMVLLDALDRDFEWEALEEELEREQEAAYTAVGVTCQGKDRYYQGQLVHIFLDQQGKGYYVLDMNPEGTVNVKIVRDEAGAVTGVAYMTAAEAERFFGSPEEESGDGQDGDWEDDDDWDGWDDDWDDWEEPVDISGKLIVAVEQERVKRGSSVTLGTYCLEEGDRVRFEVSAAGGERLSVGFAKPGETDVTYNTISNLRQEDGSLCANGTVTWKDPVEPGVYSLFVRAGEEDLTDVEGSVIFYGAHR